MRTEIENALRALLAEHSVRLSDLFQQLDSDGSFFAKLWKWFLGLFGGTHRGVTDPQQAVGSRADVHVLVVGDPGMGKSQMLTATAALAPRGVYVCGNTTSSSGLTVTVVKDAATGDFALEAGALVIPEKPGLGLEWDEDAVRANAWS